MSLFSIHSQSEPTLNDGAVNADDLSQLKKAIISAFSKEIGALRNEIFKVLESSKNGNKFDSSTLDHLDKPHCRCFDAVFYRIYAC